MKKISKVLFLFVFAFVLTKLQMGTGKVYYTPVGGSTNDISQAQVYGDVKEAYDAQNTLGADWEIIGI